MVSRQGKGGNRAPAKTSGFKYKPRSSDAINKRADAAGSRYITIFKPGFDTYRPKLGENAVRILPPSWEIGAHFGYDVWVHKYVGPEEVHYLCRFKMLNKDCAWCDAAKEAKAGGDKEEFKRLSAKPDVVYWLIDRDDEKPTPLLYQLSGMADGEISELGRSKRTGKTYYLDDPDKGWDVLIDRKGTGKKNTRYSYKRDSDTGPCPIVESQKAQDAILEFIAKNPIPSVLRYYPNDYLLKLTEGGAHEKDEDLDDEEDPRPTRDDKRRHGKRDDDEREEEEENVEDNGEGEEYAEDGEEGEEYAEDGEEGEEEEPRGGRRGGGRRRVEEDEEEEGGGEEDGEDGEDSGEDGGEEDGEDGEESGEDGGEEDGEDGEVDERPRGRRGGGRRATPPKKKPARRVESRRAGGRR